MRIYVAGRWTEKKYVKRVMSKLSDLCHEITFDWTQNADTDDEQELKQRAMLDLEGVRSADVIILLPSEGGRGMWVEMGAALAYGKPVLISGDSKYTVFQHHPLVSCCKPLNQVRFSDVNYLLKDMAGKK